MSRNDTYDRRPLVAEQPDRVVTDPVTGVATTCRELRDRAEACFRDAYAERRPLRAAGDGDPDLVRSRRGPCWRRADVVVRSCRLPVGFAGGRRRRT